MRLNYILSDLGIGLKRNLSMTIAVVVTIWVSLSLFGSALLAREQVDLMKGNWYDKIQISVFLCTKDSGGRGCSGAEVTTEQKNRIQQVIEANPDTAPDGVFGESKKEAFDQFKKLYKDSPIVSTVTEDQMQESFRVKLKDPQRYQNLVSAVAGLPGVDTVQDLRQYLDPLFNALNGCRSGALVAAGLLLVAALMQISNTIRLAAYARRREIGIMRLVGASNFYIQLPFLLEAVLAALIGAVLACGTLWLGVYFVVDAARPRRRSGSGSGSAPTETFRATADHGGRRTGARGGPDIPDNAEIPQSLTRVTYRAVARQLHPEQGVDCGPALPRCEPASAGEHQARRQHRHHRHTARTVPQARLGRARSADGGRRLLRCPVHVRRSPGGGSVCPGGPAGSASQEETTRLADQPVRRPIWTRRPTSSCKSVAAYNQAEAQVPGRPGPVRRRAGQAGCREGG